VHADCGGERGAPPRGSEARISISREDAELETRQRQIQLHLQVRVQRPASSAFVVVATGGAAALACSNRCMHVLQFNHVKDYLNKGDAEVFTKCIVPFLKADSYRAAGEISEDAFTVMLYTCILNWLDNDTCTHERVLESLEDAVDKCAPQALRLLCAPRAGVVREVAKTAEDCAASQAPLQSSPPHCIPPGADVTARRFQAHCTPAGSGWCWRRRWCGGGAQKTFRTVSSCTSVSAASPGRCTSPTANR
jgi:hypothetical protein